METTTTTPPATAKSAAKSATPTATPAPTSAASTTTTPATPNAKDRDKLMNAAAATMTPELRKEKPVDPVELWLPQIRRKHKQGYSPRQIAAMLATPGIGLKVSERTVQRHLRAKPATKKTATAATK